MKRRVVVNRVLIGAFGVLAVGLLVLLHLIGNKDAFNVVFGVVVGAAVTSIPQALSRETDRLRRTRAAAVLLRSDLYGYQEWIVESLRASRWAPTPTDMATLEHLADLAYAMPTWEKWQQLGEARRYASKLIGLSERSQPNDESRRHAWKTFEAINRARVLLAKVDDGLTRPHPATDEVRNAVALAAATGSRRKDQA